MSKVVYWMTVSLDGFVETRDGKIDWTAPDDELLRFQNERRAQARHVSPRAAHVRGDGERLAHRGPESILL